MPSFAANFATLGQASSSSGLTVANNAVSATTGGSRGTAYFPLAAGSNNLRIAFDFTFTAGDGNWFYAGACNGNNSNYGFGVGFYGGFGILFAGYKGAPDATYYGILVATPSVTTKYHVEIMMTPAPIAGNVSVTALLYGPAASSYNGANDAGDPNLVVLQRVALTLPLAWTQVTQLFIDSTSAGHQISNLVADTNIMGSSATGWGFTQRAMAYRYLNSSTNYPLQVHAPPGAPAKPLLAVFFHGTGGQTLDPFTDAPVNWDAQAAMAAGALVLQPSQYSTVSTAGQASWVNPDAMTNDILPAFAFGLSVVGANADVLLQGYSMGGAAALAVIGQGQVANIRAARIHAGVCDLAWAEQYGSLGSFVDTAWGISHQGSYSAAQAALAAADPMQLLAAHPSRFTGIQYTFDWGGLDPTVLGASNAVPFTAALAANGINTYTIAEHPTLTHTSPGSPGDAADWIASYVGGVSMAINATAAQSILASLATVNTNATAATAAATSAATAANSAATSAASAATAATTAAANAAAAQTAANSASTASAALSALISPLISSGAFTPAAMANLPPPVNVVEAST